MPTHRIWTGLDCDVEVYHLDANGNRINASGGPWVEADGPLLRYCFFQSCSLMGELPNQRRPVTGRPQRRITVLAEEYELEVEHFYLSKDSEISADEIFHREKILELVLKLQCPEDMDQVDRHTLSVAKRTSFKIGGSENDLFVGNAKFIAERFS